MIILDTNVISEITKPRPDAIALSGFDSNDLLSLYLSDVTVMELIFGAERYLIKHGSERYYQIARTIRQNEFYQRILSLDPEDFAVAGRIRAQREMVGRMMSVQDAMIAAICLQHNATPATCNTKDFEGLDLRVVNPFEGA